MTVTLLEGDCIQLMSNIKSGSIDMILADLPFGTTRQSWDKVIDVRQLWGQYERIIKQNGAIVLFAKPPFDKMLACSKLELYRYDWIWEKTRASGHLNANKMPLQAHEYMCVFYKKAPIYIPQKTELGIPVNQFYSRHSGECYGSAGALRVGGGNTDRYPRSVIRCQPVSNGERWHPNQKPVELLKLLIRSYTKKGQLILDNTMGSGSTIVASAITGRRCIGMENDTRIFKTAKKRLTKENIKFFSNFHTTV